MIVVYDVLRVLKAVVGTQEVLEWRPSPAAGLVTENDIEHLSRSFIVVRQASFTQFLSCTVQMPVDTLYGDEHQPQQPEQTGRHGVLNDSPVARQLHCFWPITTVITRVQWRRS